MISHETSPGPQCLSCKKRRVRCDSTKPACTRCLRDGNECPGYVKPFKWNNLSSNTCPAKRHRRQRDNVHTQLSSTPTPELTVSIPFSFGWAERELHLLLESVQYYNAHILPDAVPTQQSLQRPEFNFQEWRYLPKLLQRVLIVIVRTTQAMKASIDATSKHDLYHYRGLVLTELNTSLPYAAVDPTGLVLGCILLVMLADIQLSATGSWTTHLEAARRVIRLRGGFSKCYSELPWFSDLLIHYMNIDILSATTCDAHLLDLDSITTQREYIPLLPSLEGHIISNCCPCPQILLQAIIHMNILRASSVQDHPASTTDSNPQTTFSQILHMIQTFNPSLWAPTIPYRAIPNSPSIPQSLPDTVSWTALALAYKSATLLYLLLSRPLLRPLRDSHLGPSNCSSPQPPHEQREYHPLLPKTHSTLSQQLSSLFAVASPLATAPVHAQLWKFVVWPLVVCGYVRVGFADLLAIGREAGAAGREKPSVDEVEQPEESLEKRQGKEMHVDEKVEREIERLSATAVALGARSLSDAAVLLRRSIRERSEFGGSVRGPMVTEITEGGGRGRGRARGNGERRRWDEAWRTRCAFVI